MRAPHPSIHQGSAPKTGKEPGRDAVARLACDGEGLAAARLSVGEDGGIDAVEGSQDVLSRDKVEHVFLFRILLQDAVELEQVLILLVVHELALVKGARDNELNPVVLHI
eukprot:scaffold40_cov413-Prasinococcus_capsulatus_cf.AAC.6